ncbi:MAG TPA: LemA family protein [Ferruginibacter sp.]|jgi:LemA protein|nr:LemA family protein [Chitinophagales bacterium]HNF01589.1 LemA family protein [Ferruginibacter sp.]HNF44149.1 LemA family protein [Ferruginibacter sp.]HNJ29881.1 LemA family protein [Ferruginibacter sp.]HNK30416.1 LemA family protein [Ferruginibacter sp.]
MTKQKSSWLIIGVVVAIVVVYLITTFNSLVKKEERIKLQWNEVQNAYQRRLNLIPNIVNVVKGVSDFEQTTLEKIAEARSKAASVTFSGDNVTAGDVQKQSGVQNELAVATNNLIIQIEKYPSLKGTAAYAGLQTQLEGTERRIKVARQDFNEAINSYNNAVRAFPAKLVAGMLGFKVKEGFQSDAGAEKPVEIKF